MKAQREHMVPLSDDALAILQAVPRFEGSPYVFPVLRGSKISDMSLSAVIKRMDVDATVHGFRSTLRDWMGETTSYPHEVAEMTLAHTIPSPAECAYRRGNLLEKRRALMAEWAEYCITGIPESAAVHDIGEARR